MSRPLLSRLAWRRGLLEGSRRWIIVSGWRRGVLQGSRGWLVLGLCTTALQLLRRLLAEPEARTTIELRDGGIEIRTVDPSRR
jgi:hypothetical protein